MRHRVGHRKLGRVTEHRISLLRNQAEALLRHERIETTMPKAKELRPYVERLITIAKRGLASEVAGDAVTARRMVLRDIPNKVVVSKLFDTLAPRFAERPGGYTRILRVGYRRGDSAEVAQIELLGSEYNPAADEEKTQLATEAKSKGVSGRLRAAAERLRGRGGKEKEDAEAVETKPSPTRRAGRAGSAAAKKGPGKKGQ